jgi:hypothetical protein
MFTVFATCMCFKKPNTILVMIKLWVVRFFLVEFLFVKLRIHFPINILMAENQVAQNVSYGGVHLFGVHFLVVLGLI